MFRAIVVDDEIKALERFERLIEHEENISLVGSFTRSLEALEFIKQNEVDIAFLDIEMPEMNGLELSENLFEIKPQLNVIFVTAYDKYALQAFEAHSIGYLLKPVSREDIRKQTASLLKRSRATQQSNTASKLTVRCLGQFECMPNGNGDDRIRWRTAKAEEFFALLVHGQGKTISRETIIDALWPEMEPEKSTNNLHVTWYYVREVLRDKGFEGILTRNRNGYQLRTEDLQCDMLDFTKSVAQLQSGGGSVELTEKTAQLYKGTYLGDRPYAWANYMSVWLDSEYEKLLYQLADAYHSSGETVKELEALKRLVHHNPMADEAYKLLIELSVRQEDYAMATGYYKKYEKILSDELGISPPEYIRQMMKNFR